VAVSSLAWITPIEKSPAIKATTGARGTSIVVSSLPVKEVEAIRPAIQWRARGICVVCLFPENFFGIMPSQGVYSSSGIEQAAIDATL